MRRRRFILNSGLAAGGMLNPVAGAAVTNRPLAWKRSETSKLFNSLACEGQDLVAEQQVGLLNGRCRLWGEEHSSRLDPNHPTASHGPLRLELRHTLRDSGSGLGEDLLEAEMVVQNTSDQAQEVEISFTSSAQPSRAKTAQQAYLPLNAAGLHSDKRFTALGVENFLGDCRQDLGRGSLSCHYLEPMASTPDERTTRALLLVPVVDVHLAGTPWHLALFTASDEPMKFNTGISEKGNRTWTAGRVQTIKPGETLRQRCWLMLHQGDASTAWKAFHRFAHHEDHTPIEWTQKFKVHYYDYLSSAKGKNGRRGDGYDADMRVFKEFHVGMATQHGFYATLGDYIHPDRKSWMAMQNDHKGPVKMSLDIMRERIRATRATGAKAAIYLHPVLLDDGSEVYSKMKDSVLVGADGERVPFPWVGPETIGKNWRASLACPDWRDHMLQQVEWVMELLEPDALCIDETFAGLGYDHHPDHSGPTSAAAIDWHRRMRDIVRSHGQDRAVFTSDCSMSSFVLWADGEVGDHAYPNSLGNPLYSQEPVRYLSAIGDKAWRPCAWHFGQMWKQQMALAKQVGAGVGVSNGWLEYTGLHALPEADKKRIIADIDSIL